MSLLLLTTISLALHSILERGTCEADQGNRSWVDQHETITSLQFLMEGRQRNMKRVVADTGINTLKQVFVLVQAFQTNEADRLIRRNINTTFINTLVDQFQGLPQALIWLKTSMGIRTAGKMVDDFGYTGSLLQRLADTVNDAYHWVRSIKVRGRLIGVAIDFLSKFHATAMSY